MRIFVLQGIVTLLMLFSLSHTAPIPLRFDFENIIKTSISEIVNQKKKFCRFVLLLTLLDPLVEGVFNIYYKHLKENHLIN